MNPHRTTLPLMEHNAGSVAIVFGESIRRLRKGHGFSQALLAEKAGISQTYLSAIERGLKFPTAEIIEALARVLEVPFYELFVDTQESEVPTPFTTEAFLFGFQEEVGRMTRDWVTRFLKRG